MKTPVAYSVKTLVFIILLTSCKMSGVAQPNLYFIKKGEITDLISSGMNWTTSQGSLNGSEINNYLVAGKSLAVGDLRVQVRLSLDSLDFSAASLMIGAQRGDRRLHYESIVVV